jgi:hemolysin III
LLVFFKQNLWNIFKSARHWSLTMMAENIITVRYSIYEEIASSITHGVGIVLAIAGLGVLTAFASVFGDAWHITSCSIFGATLIVLYTASTLYHSIQSPRSKAVLRVIDHSAVFLLIAGSYTPIALVNLRGPWGWSLFGVVWGLAVLGILSQVFFINRWKILSIVLYLAMGWVVVVAIRPLLASMAAGGLILLVSGGLSYTVGVIFYAWKKMPFNHAVWHLFVLAGSILHYFSILFYVIPVAY